MIRPRTIYTQDPECILVLVNLREPEACDFVHRQRGIWQAYSDLAGFGPDHMILILFPGGALELLP
jgi:hypothetical protein